MQLNPLFAGLGPFAGLAQTGTQLATRGIQGLFGIKDPEIEAQRAIAMAAQNPNDPATLQAAAQALAQAGKIDQAMALAGQARAITREDRTFALQEKQFKLSEEQAERAKRTLSLQEETAFLDKLAKSPRAAMADIVAMDDGPKKNMLLAQASQSMDKARVDEEYKQAQIEALRAQARTAGLKGFEVIKDSLGKPIGRFNKATGEIEDMPGVKDTGGAGGAEKTKLTDEEIEAKMTGETKTDTEIPAPFRSRVGQMGRNRAAQARGIPNPPPMMTRGGRRNPEYDEWERLYGAAYRAQMAGQ